MKRVLFVLLFIFIVSAMPKWAFAARLSISPSSSSVSVGQTVSVSVILSSIDQSSNAVGGTITFPTSKFQVVSVSKSSSILSLWVEEPSFSNSAGTITFQGVVPNPGFKGSRGTVVTTTLRAITSGSATINITQGSVLANDGMGTNILTDSQGSTITINSAKAADTKVEEQKTNASEAPVISSKTHPSSSKWYSTSELELNWSLPSDVLASKFILDKNSKSTPSTIDAPAINEKIFEDLDDGVWYFNLQLKNNKGWSSVATFKAQIDKTPPTTPVFDLVPSDNGSPSILIKSSDELSGLDHFRVKFGDNPYETYDAVQDLGGINILAKYPGQQTVIVESYDKAGNNSIAAKELNIKTFDAPTISDLPASIDKGKDLIIKGVSVQNAEVIVYLKGNGSEEIYKSTRPESNGNFQISFGGNIPNGEYVIYAISKNVNGVMSLRSENKFLTINPSLMYKIGSAIATFGSFAIFIFMLFIGFWRVCLTLLRYINKLRKGTSQDINSMNRSIYLSFYSLKNEIQSEVRALERAKTKRKLSLDEERIINKFGSGLDSPEIPTQNK